MHRRTLLTGIGAGTLALAGCTTGADSVGTEDGTDDADLPEGCPTTQGFDVEWPEELDASTVESFVEAYEQVYFREVVVEYEPESRLDSYELSGSVTDPPRKVGDGWALAYSGGGGVYRPTLLVEATASDPPDGTDPVQATAIDDEALTETLEAAAETGNAEFRVDPGGEVDRYVDLLASRSDDFERLSGPGDSDALYVDVDGTAVELSVTATNFHGDYWWEAWYYVDEQVVRRTTEEEDDPRDGDLLECRRLE